ncbi:MAG: DUF389 domain-containing protein [Huintestinicola sp.]
MKEKIKEIFSVRDNMLSYADIDRMMVENTKIHGSNMCILMLAILIASVGLNTNSAPVIIGAMLISPLMSGIMTMGYSVAVKDLRLCGRAFIRFAIQVVICLATSAAYFALSPLSASTSELLARTRPNIWDVIIAICGGLAGMIGCTRTEKTNVIPGVAIATALMPPLCTAGYGIGTGQWSFFWGAFYLFFINTLFIAISSGIVTIALGVPHRPDLPSKIQKKINRQIIFLVVLTVIPSLMAASVTVYDSVTEGHINRFVEAEFDDSSRMIVKQKNDLAERTITLAVIGKTVSEDEIEEISSRLPDYDLDGFTLKIIQNTDE